MAIGDPEFQVLVDWNNDGDYSDSGDDITSRVESLTVSRFRDLISGYMAGAVLTMSLDNKDHEYSPPNSGSGLSGKLVPGRKVWVRVWYPYDDFVGTIDTALASHTPTRDPGWAWVNDRNTWELNGGGAARCDGSGSGDFIATLEFNDVNVSLAGDFFRGTDTSDHGGIVFRYVDATHYAYVRVTGSYIEIRKVIGTLDTQISIISHAWSTSTTKYLQLWLHGDLAYVYVNNAVVVNGQDVSDGGIDAGTKHGLFADGPCDHNWNFFGGYRSLFLGAIDRIRPRPSLGDETTYIKALDGFEKMRSTASTHENYVATAGGHIADTIGEIASEYGVDGEGQRYDTGVQLVLDGASTPFQGLKSAEGDIHGLVQAYQDEENGFAYFDGQGYFVFEGSAHRDSAPHDAAMSVLRDAPHATDGYVLSDGFAWDDGWDAVENNITIKFQRASLSSGGTLMWEHEQAKDTAVAVQFDAHEIRYFLVELTDYDYAPTWDSLVGEYKATTQVDGLGTLITGDLSVAYLETDKFDGRFRKIEVVFGATAGYLNQLQVKGTALTLQDFLPVNAGDSSSQTAYGRRSKTISALWIDRHETAQDQAAARLADRKDPRTELTVKLANADKPTSTIMIQRRMSDRVTIVYSEMDISNDFYIEGEEWEISEGGKKVRRTLQLRSV
jgi:hypothetical protein